MLSQEHDGLLHPVEYYSRKLVHSEKKYGSRDQKLLAVKEACAHWEHLLHGKHTKVFSDHENLSHLMHSKDLKRRDARWLDQLQALDIEIVHIEGKEYGAADALSRRPDYAALKTVHIASHNSQLLSLIREHT